MSLTLEALGCRRERWWLSPLSSWGLCVTRTFFFLYWFNSVKIEVTS